MKQEAIEARIHAIDYYLQADDAVKRSNKAEPPMGWTEGRCVS